MGAPIDDGGADPVKAATANPPPTQRCHATMPSRSATPGDTRLVCSKIDGVLQKWVCCEVDSTGDLERCNRSKAGSMPVTLGNAAQWHAGQSLSAAASRNAKHQQRGVAIHSAGLRVQGQWSTAEKRYGRHTENEKEHLLFIPTHPRRLKHRRIQCRQPRWSGPSDGSWARVVMAQ